MIDLSHFRAEYRQAVDEIRSRITPGLLEGLATHNKEILRWDPIEYLIRSEVRYVKALALLNAHTSSLDELLEVGGFLGAFPLALARTGVRVVVVERYDLYEGALDGVRELLRRSGAVVVDADLTQQNGSVGRFPIVVNMAMAEHIAGSPRVLLENLRDACSQYLVFEVPNIAYSYKRWDLARGRSIHPALAEVYESNQPFTGHHREYTCREVTELLSLAGFHVETLTTFNYSGSGWRTALRPQYLAALLAPSFRETILAIASPR
jgi:hypothetical protein